MRRIPADIAKQIVELDNDGMNQDQIAATVGYRRETISRIVARNNQRVYERLTRSHVAERGRQVKLLAKMFREAMEAWEKSKNPSVTLKIGETTSRKSSKNGQSAWSERIVATQCGDPAYLEQMLNILRDIRVVMMMEKTPRRDKETNPAAGDWDVTQALSEIAAMAKELEAEEA
jgi:hypothetical protein